MKIFCAHFHPNGFFVSADQQDDFWVFLSKQVGWGKFTLVRPEDEFTPSGGLYVLSEIRPASSVAPKQLVGSSVILWSRKKVILILIQCPSSPL